METVILIYLILMFIALYFFSFFIILTFRNRHALLSYPKPKKIYSTTLIIPAHNEEAGIEETVKCAEDLDYPKDKIEIIVVNNASEDKTKEIVTKLLGKYKNLKLLECSTLGKAHAINLGIKNAKGELIGVIDADSFPSSNSLGKLTGYFNDPQMGAVTSFVTVRNKDENFFAKIQSLEYVVMGWNKKMLDFIGAIYVTNGPLSLYRKSFLNQIGGFDPKSITEDIEVTWNMLHHNYKTALCFDADVSTITPHKFKKWFNQRVRWGIGGLQAISKYKKDYFKKGIFGSFIIPYISFSILLSLFAFIFSSYLLIKYILTRFLTVSYSISTQSSVFSFNELNLHPSVTIFYFVIMFSMSILYSNYILKTVKYEKNLSVGKFFNLLFYVLVYLTLYPLIWFVSIYRFVKKDYRW